MIELKNIYKKYEDKEVLKEMNLKIEKGSFTFITGKSGSGKTTLLNIIGLLEKPTSGEVLIDNYVNPKKKDFIDIRRNLFGYLFQNYGLIENETVENNIKIGLKFSKLKNKDKEIEIEKVLDKLELGKIKYKKVYKLSGGEQQRVALGRIMVKESEYILADEPTGNLDNVNRDRVYNILTNLNKEGKTIIFVTHDKELIKRGNNTIEL